MKSLVSVFLWLAVCQVAWAQKVRLAGRVVDDTSAVAVENATVQLLPLADVQTTGPDGEFVFSGLPPGGYQLVVTQMGYATETVALQIGKSDLALTIRLKSRSFYLDEVTVVAQEQRMGSSSVIGRSAMIHVQPISLADVLQLVPGQLSVNPNLVTAQQVTLRQVPSTPDAARANALGTAIIQDGVPVSNNANLQTDVTILNSPAGSLPPFSSVAGRGLDLRQIGADNIESVEVVRGIPSVRYGDLTSGLVLVSSRIGAFRPEMRIRANPNAVQAAFLAGFKAGKRGGTLNANLDFVRSQADPRDILDQYTRLNGQLAWQKNWGGGKRFVTTTILSGYQTLDERRQSPDDLRQQRRNYARDQGIKFSTEGKWQAARPWLHRLRYIASATYANQQSFFQELVTRDLFPLSTALTDTTQPGRFGESEYLSQITVSGRPLNLYGNWEAGWVLETFRVRHNVSLGMEYRLDANYGEGRQFDPTRPPHQNYSAGDRPRSYRDIPPLAQLTYYVEDRLSGSVAGRNFILQAGLRLDNAAPTGIFRSKYGIVPAPRLNLSVETLPDLWLRGGLGVTAKAPTLSFLYPGERYFDLVNFNYFAVNPAERLVIITTRVVDLDGQRLRPFRSRKGEVGLDFQRKGFNATVTLFRESTTGAFGFNRTVRPYPVARFVIQDTLAGRPPVLNPVPIRVDTFFAGYDVPVSNRSFTNRGLEFTFDTPEWKAVRTSFNFTGAWIRTNSFDDGSFMDADRVIFSTVQPTRVPVYANASNVTASRFNTTVRLIHRIPKLGFVLSAVWQAVWLDRNRGEVLSQLPTGYVDRRGNLVNLTAEQAARPEYSDLRRVVDERNQVRLNPPPLHLLNFRITKEWSKGYGFSLYANNFIGARPLFFNDRSQTFVRRNEPLFFGAEVNATL